MVKYCVYTPHNVKKQQVKEQKNTSKLFKSSNDFPVKELAVTMFLPHTIVLKKRFISVGMVILFLFPSYLVAETVNTEEWQISADKITRYEEPESIVAEGNIVLTKLTKLPPKSPKKAAAETGWSLLLEEEVTEQVITPEELPGEEEVRYETKVVIKADWMAYDVALENIRARGNIYIKMGGDQLYAAKGTVNLKQMTGTFTDATVLREEKDFHLEGKVVKKTGLKTYRVEDGWVITCKIDKGETPPWSFAATDTEVTKGGYAHLRHVRFNIKNVPVFYLPYLIIPAKNTRQTGFLFPEFSYSTYNGFGINVPFFLNISNSVDMTFYPQHLINRGFMPGVEFRYISSANNKGVFVGSYLNDNLTDPSETEYYDDTGYTHTNKDRYWVRGKIDHTSKNNWITRVDLDIVSDRDYLDEFNFGITGFKKTNSRFIDVFGRGFENTTDSKRQNSLKILKTWGDISFEADFLAINDASDTEATTATVNEDGTTTTVTNPTPLWQLPSIELGGVHAIGDTSLSFTWDADYVNFWREEGIGGHRLDIHPRLSMPVPLGPYFESRAEAGIRETLYVVNTYGDAEWEHDDTPNRFLYDFNTEVGTTLLRDYQLNSDTYKGWTHELRPFIKYEYIADVDQEDLPQYNSVDAIGDRNRVTYGVSNFFNLFGTKEAEEFTEKFAEVTIQQDYDFRSEASDEPFGPIVFEIELTPWNNFDFEYTTKYDVYDSDLTYHRVSTNYSNSRGDSLELDYKYDDDGDTEQINAKINLKILASLTGEYEIKYSLSADQVNEQAGALTYQAACWSVTLKSTYTPEDTSVIVLFELLNIGSPMRVSL